MENLPKLLRGDEIEEYKKLKPVIEKCYQEMISANLTNQDVQTVIDYLHRIARESALKSRLR
jgi:hypothetical protein